MAFGTRVLFTPIGEVAFGSLTGTYQALGAPVVAHPHIIKFTNTTNVDVYISENAVANHLRIPAGGFALFDFTANKVRDDGLFVQQGTQFYVKQQTTGASQGAVWIEVISALGGP